MYIYSILKLQNLTKLPQEIAVTTALILIVRSVFIKVSSVPDIMQGPGETKYMEQPFLLRGSWSSMCKQIRVLKFYWSPSKHVFGTWDYCQAPWRHWCLDSRLQFKHEQFLKLVLCKVYKSVIQSKYCQGTYFEILEKWEGVIRGLQSGSLPVLLSAAGLAFCLIQLLMRMLSWSCIPSILVYNCFMTPVYPVCLLPFWLCHLSLTGCFFLSSCMHLSIARFLFLSPFPTSTP